MRNDNLVGTWVIAWTWNRANSRGLLRYNVDIQLLEHKLKCVVSTEKTEKAARDEAIAKCKDQTLVSVCRAENLKCTKN